MIPILIIIPIFIAIITFIFYVQQFINSEQARKEREDKRKVAYFGKTSKKGSETEEDYTYHPNENI